MGSGSSHMSEDSVSSVGFSVVAEGPSSGGTGTKKVGGKGLVRGVSVRAGKNVKRLDTALDFVDAR